MDQWIFERLVCPRHRTALKRDGDHLVCTEGDRFPVIDGIPVMLMADVEQTLWVAAESLQMAVKHLEGRSIGVEQESMPSGIDPDVQGLVAKTCGYLYVPLIGKLDTYPIPDLRLPQGSPHRTFLDVGCGWGRWCIAAAKKEYTSVGLDPSLRGVLAARRVARQLGASCKFVVGDARFLPFAPASFDIVFSYSVLQHFSKNDARRTLASIATTLKSDGLCKIQMPNRYGLRSFYHQIKRGFREGKKFDVRYWTPSELITAFSKAIGDASISVDGFFGLGIQPSDVGMLPLRFRLVVRCSEMLRRIAHYAPWLTNIADSLYVTAKPGWQGAHSASVVGEWRRKR